MLPVTILIPVKDPYQSKTRLSGLLSSSERSTLAANMLMRVIQAAARSEVDDIVVAGSQLNSLKQLIEVQEFGSVRWVDVLGQDLNGDVEIASAGIKNSGRAYIYIPSDVPFVTSNDIEDVIRSSEDGGIFVFVPSGSDGGTNAMLIPSPVPIFLVMAALTARNATTFASSSDKSLLHSSSNRPYATGEPLPVVT